MGVRNYAHLGPYFICKNEPFLRDVSYHTCENTRCPRYSLAVDDHDSYCRSCGTRIGAGQDKLVAHSVDTSGLASLLQDNLYVLTYSGCQIKDGYDIWVVNDTSRCDVYSGRPSSIDTRDEINAWEILPQQIATEKLLLAGAFAKEYCTLQDAYGARNVELHWGLVIAAN